MSEFQLTNWTFNAAAPAELLENIELAIGRSLPRDYVAFLRTHSGGEGPTGRCDYLIVFRAEELLDLNRSYGINEYVPGLFLFGSDGCGEAFCFDMRQGSMPIVSVPWIGMSFTTIEAVASNFTTLLQFGRPE